MRDLNAAINIVNSFLENDDEKFLLLKGIDDDNKIKVVTSCLNKSKFNKGLLRIGNTLNDIPRILWTVGVVKPKSSYKYNKFYRIGNMNIKIDSYYSKRTMRSRFEKFDFVIIYPIQTIANRINEHDWFTNMLKDLKSEKVLLITTNDSNYKFDWIEQMMDVVYSYDSKNDKPELYERLMRFKEQEKIRKKYL